MSRTPTNTGRGRLTRFWNELPQATLEVRRGELPPDDLVSYERPASPPPGFQRSFDLMASWMLKQAAPARSPDGKNRYRTGTGAKCPVGALLGAGSGDIEGLSALDPFLQTLLRQRGHNPGLAWSLQAVHDHIAPADWPEYLRRMAEWYRLDSRIVDELERQFRARLYECN